jgi:hypothetical protein
VTKKLFLALLGLIGSLPFLYLGLSAVLGALAWTETSGVILLLLGAANVAYALASLVLIGLAWHRPSGRWHRISACCGGSLVLAWAVASLDSGGLSGLEWGTVLGLGFMAALIWSAILFIARDAAA